MTILHNKAHELDARDIMQGLEEFATFMSFQSSQSHMRILSVETTQPTALPKRSVTPLRSVLNSRPLSLSA
jgi:hypothetical protein